MDIKALKKRVFEHFKAICEIPHGSGNMDKIAEYLVAFANKNDLKFVKDKANNVIIFKDATKGYELVEPIILQGHIDMVCQKEPDCNIDFETDGLNVFVQDGFLSAKGTTLGADNGIAVSYILTILENDDVEHPAIEAVFTTDEEIGMLGAISLDTSVLRGKKLINLDSEKDDTITVSCAGGTDFIMEIPLQRKMYSGTQIEVNLCGLRGGHSGVEINAGRQNANILAGRFLNHMQSVVDFELISINGGDKNNAITPACCIKICTKQPDKFELAANACLNVIKAEIQSREPNFAPTVSVLDKKRFYCIDKKQKDEIIFLLAVAPYGVVEMSAEIDGLVETSLNLGVLKTNDNDMCINFSVRSNKQSAMEAVLQKLRRLSKCVACSAYTTGFYPPWEYKENSDLQRAYSESFYQMFKKEPKVEAIHAGLECGVFCSKIPELECISIGPALYDIHTTKERLDIASAEKIFELVLNVIKSLK